MENQRENLFPVVDLHVATDDKDRHRLKIEKFGQFFFPTIKDLLHG